MVELPHALNAWRCAGVGRVVESAHDGKITLWDWQEGRLFYARFRDAAAATAAVQGAVEWTRKNRAADPGGFAARGRVS